MCNREEWDRFARRAYKMIDEDQVRELVEDAAVRLEGFAEELRRWAQSTGPECAGGTARPTRRTWVA